MTCKFAILCRVIFLAFCDFHTDENLDFSSLSFRFFSKVSEHIPVKKHVSKMTSINCVLCGRIIKLNLLIQLIQRYVLRLLSHGISSIISISWCP